MPEERPRKKESSEELSRVVGQLRTTLGRLELALGSIEEAIVWTDSAGKISWCNTAFGRLAGMHPIYILGMDLARLLPLKLAETPLPAEEHPAALGLKGLAACGEYIFLQDNSARDLEISYSPVDSHGNERNCILTLRDITGRKHAEKRMKKLNRMLRTLSEFNQALVREPAKMDLADDLCRILIDLGGYRRACVALLRPDGELSVAATAEQGRRGFAGDRVCTQGYLRSAVTAREPLITSDLRTDPLFNGDNSDALAAGCVSRIVLPVAAKDQPIGLLVIYSAEQTAFEEKEDVDLLVELAGDLAYGIASARARAGLEKALADLGASDEKLRQAQKMEAVGRLAGGVAHDFNNLITAILGYSGMLQSTLKPDDPRSEDLLEIETAANRAAALTRQLLAFSRKQVLLPKNITLNSIIEHMQKMLSRIIGEDIEIAIALDPQLKRTAVDEAQIEQVILNLAVNARDAMPRGGKLTIETRNAVLAESSPERHDIVPPGPYTVLTVSDAGMGMDEETKKHIFEPFFTTKGHGKGTGLGLSTVYGIVKQSGGYIWVHSEPGKGTAFTLYFPQTNIPAEPQRPAAPAPALKRGSGTVLLVEDDDVVRRLLSRTLRQNGYAVLEARTGIEALELYRSRLGEIAAVVTDLVMPGMGGRALGECLKELRQDIRVLYISGYTDDAIARHGELCKDAFFLQKPVMPHVFLAKLQEVLGESADAGKEAEEPPHTA